ncbi:7940_t:CDS:2 [Acaulospora colombiana]|uniref:7940_t:CDS:1 n=1 Tax=Acaulospora colombiana TaxID=27376 RepID=A0ACA9N2F7_9GLOM|nr:7940_t:CDS:2 [Acaulospora colombiana]
MVKDMTPFPDQDMIHNNLVRAKFRSKIDLSDVYKQVCVKPDDVWKTAFSMPVGTFISQVLQQGDCNRPSTFQRLCTHVFRECIGRGVHPYIDDIHVYLDTTKEHEDLLCYMFKALYPKNSKVKIFNSVIE